MPSVPDARLLLLSGLGVLFVGGNACTFVEGQPWAQVDNAELAVAPFVPGTERLDGQGRLKTARSYAVKLEQIELELADLRIQQADAAGEPLAFDPASPPPGYSLCHGGHCHAEDGTLPTYAEVEAKLLGGATAAPSLGFHVEDTEVPVVGEARQTLRCQVDPCMLQRGPIVGALLDVTAVRLVGTAFDLTDERRLPEAGTPFAVSLGPPAPLLAPLNTEAERFEPVHREVGLTLALAESILDDVDFAADVAEGGFSNNASDAAALRFLEDSEFVAHIEESQAIEDSSGGEP